MNSARMAIIIVGCVAFMSIIMAMTLIIITGHDLTGFSIAFGSVCTSAAGFITVLRFQRKQAEMLHAQNQEIATVKKNTNGTLTRLLDSYEKIVAREAIMASTAPAEIVTAMHENTLDAHEIQAIRERISD